MKFIKYISIILLILFVGAFIAIKLMSEKEPEGKIGPEADNLANEIFLQLNKNAFDSIPYLKWEFFVAGNKYLWDKKANKAIISFNNYEVLMDLNTQKSICKKDGEILMGKEKEKISSKAWSNWCNDSFWLIAPFKLFDSGTTRKIVDTDEGKGLMIEYKSGGVTPGDKYLWILDQNNRPTGWKMWTKIIPIKGMYSAWSGWENHGGAILSTTHTLAGKEVSIKNLEFANKIAEFGFVKDPFIEI